MTLVVCFSISLHAYAAHYALLIGVGKYVKNKQFQSLSGPPKDVRKLEGFLRKKLHYTNITVLLNEQATKANIMKHLRRLARLAGKNDPVVVYFSGHGSRVDDPDGDEKDDNLDETLVPYDINANRSSHVIDDDIYKWLSSMKSEKLTVIFDSCHSGGAHKGATGKGHIKYLINPYIKGTKGARGEIFIRNYSSNVQKPNTASPSKPESAYGPRNFVFVSASQSSEFAYDAGGTINSVLTHYMVQGLYQTPNASASHLRSYVSRQIGTQWRMTPHILGAVSRPLFYSLASAPKPCPPLRLLATNRRCKAGICASFSLRNKNGNLSTSFKNMEEFTLRFHVNKDVYVAVFNVDYKNKVSNTFPKDYYSTLKVLVDRGIYSKRLYKKATRHLRRYKTRYATKANKTYLLPAGTDNPHIGMRFRVKNSAFGRSCPLIEKYILVVSTNLEAVKLVRKAYKVSASKGGEVFIRQARKHTMFKITLRAKLTQ